MARNAHLFQYFSSFLASFCCCCFVGIGTRNQIDSTRFNSYTYTLTVPPVMCKCERSSKRSAAVCRCQKYTQLAFDDIRLSCKCVVARTLKVAPAQHKSNWKLTKIALKCYFETRKRKKKNKNKTNRNETKSTQNKLKNKHVDSNRRLDPVTQRQQFTSHLPLKSNWTQLFYYCFYRFEINELHYYYYNVIIWSHSLWCLAIIFSIRIYLSKKSIPNYWINNNQCNGRSTEISVDRDYFCFVSSERSDEQCVLLQQQRHHLLSSLSSFISAFGFFFFFLLCPIFN